MVCSDEHEHRDRLEARQRNLDPYPEPTWGEVMTRRDQTEPWRHSRLVIDTVVPIDQNVEKAVDYLNS